MESEAQKQMGVTAGTMMLVETGEVALSLELAKLEEVRARRQFSDEISDSGADSDSESNSDSDSDSGADSDAGADTETAERVMRSVQERELLIITYPKIPPPEISGPKLATSSYFFSFSSSYSGGEQVQRQQHQHQQLHHHQQQQQKKRRYLSL